MLLTNVGITNKRRTVYCKVFYHIQDAEPHPNPINKPNNSRVLSATTAVRTS
jgi:hypothetical protein